MWKSCTDVPPPRSPQPPSPIGGSFSPPRERAPSDRLADRAGIEHEGAPASASDLGQGPRICLYRDLAPEGSGDVPDPWYGGHQDFLDTLEVIERVTPTIITLAR